MSHHPSASSTPKSSTHPLKPPVAEKRPLVRTIHGYSHTDPYGWLRATNWREVMTDKSLMAADIRSYIEAENFYTDEFFNTLDGLPEKLIKELRARIKEDDTSPPVRHGPYLYFSEYEEGADFPRYLRRLADQDPMAQDTVLLDGQALFDDHKSRGAPYFSFGVVTYSPDHTQVLYSLDLAGNEIYEFFIKDIATDETRQLDTEQAAGSAIWDADSASFYYPIQDENLRPCAVRFYDLAANTQEEVYREQDPEFFVNIRASEAEDHLIVSSHTAKTTELWVKRFASEMSDTSDKPAESGLSCALTCLSPREAGHDYAIAQTEAGWFIRTNQHGAEDFALYYSAASLPIRGSWQPYRDHRKGSLIETIIGRQNFLTWIERKEGTLRLYRSARLGIGDKETALKVPPEDITPVTGNADIYYPGGHEYADERLRIGYSTLKDPATTIDIHLETGGLDIVKIQEIPSGHKADNYRTASLMARSQDGTLVPISLIYHKDTKLDGTAPALLYGYASYGYSLDPGFRANRFSLIDRGFIYALAHCRGGMDKGYHWYRDSLKTQKKNSFLDFTACANELIEQGYTSYGRIIAHGGSAGGMLVGASVNMDPGLFGGVIAQVPFVDCLNTMLDDGLPLTPIEWEEWGNPITDKEIFDYIRSYAPYETIKEVAYPFIYATGGLADPRVTYWEPAKWVARLRDIAGAQTEHAGRDFYLDIDMTSGHGGVAGRLARFRDIAKCYAFALAITGRKEADLINRDQRHS